VLKRPLLSIAFVLLAAAPASLAWETKPAPTGFAPLSDADRLPTWSEPVRVQYQVFLATLSPRAFALSPDGVHWAWQSGNDNAVTGALQRCNQRADEPCQLYAVDNDVVWPRK
jgi:hypothetical protein